MSNAAIFEETNELDTKRERGQGTRRRVQERSADTFESRVMSSI